jgi:sodium/bile acid cotransporter 7
VTRNKKYLQVVDRGSILLVVYAAFSEGMVEGIWGRLSPAALGALLGACVVLLGVVLALTWFGSRRFRRADRITVLFCGSKKSLASGLPMAGVLFAGPQVGLLVLPLMLFHQIQLMACAALAGRLARHAEEPAAAPVPA